ncbi:MAG: HPF/RaiA family ribosome-associated protein [Silvanigrellaceae bacterium]
MTIYTEIAYRDMEPSPRLSNLIQKKMDKIEKIFAHISACRVVIEAPHKHSLRGNLFHVRIDLSAPMAELVASRDASVKISHEQVDVAIRDAFSALARQLQKHKEKLRLDFHIPDKLPTGVVKELFPYEDYGIIEASNGREIYFHRNSVVEGEFDRFKIGDELRFNEELGAKGPQASTVHFARRRSSGNVEKSETSSNT